MRAALRWMRGSSPRMTGRGWCARRINPPASRIFWLTRVTRIFEKNVFTETAPAGPGGTPLGIFVARAPCAFRSDEKKVSRTGFHRSDLMQPMVVGNRNRFQVLALGLFFATNTATSTCPYRMGLEPAGDRRPTAPTATAPEGLGGRRAADRPSSVPAWASPAAPAWGGARRQ